MGGLCSLVGIESTPDESNVSVEGTIEQGSKRRGIQLVKSQKEKDKQGCDECNVDSPSMKRGTSDEDACDVKNTESHGVIVQSEVNLTC